MRVASLQGHLELGGDYWRWVQASRINRAEPQFTAGGVTNNIGDWFVTQIVDRLVDFDDLLLVPRNATAAQWDVVNQSCDVLLLKGGNFLYPGFLADSIGVETIRRIKIPIVIMGAGIQNRDDDGRVPFTPDDVEILRYIHDSCAASSIRGHRSAEALAAIGIDNAIVTGCPTIFWERDPALAIRRPAADDTGFTFRSWLYRDDDAPYRAQLRALEQLRVASARTTVLLQGEELQLQRLHMARQWGATHAGRLVNVAENGLQRLERTPIDVAALRAELHFRMDHLASPEAVDWLIANTFFSWDIADYLERYRKLGLVMGCRLHSNLLSLASGTPAFSLTYDDRTREIVDLLSIPGCELEDFGPDHDPFAADWAPFMAAYRRQYAEMVRFLDLNGLRHRLPAPLAPDAPGPAAGLPVVVALPGGADEPTSPSPEEAVALLDELFPPGVLRRLDWGCGEHPEPGWLAADLKEGPGIHLTGDIRRGLALPDGCLDYVVSIHALPMISYTDLVPVLAELRRVLRPGGVLRLGLPDLDKNLAAYRRGDRDFFLIPDETEPTLSGKLIIQLMWYGWSVTPFTAEFIESLLLRAGFREVRHCSLGESPSGLAGICDLDNRPDESLFVEAVR